MRKILFKAKSVQDNKWHYGYVYSISDSYIMLKEQNTKNIIECYKDTLCQLIADLSPDMELWENDIIKISLLEDGVKVDEVQGTIILNDFNIAVLKYNNKEHMQIFTETYKKEKQNNYKIDIEKIGTIFQ